VSPYKCSVLPLSNNADFIPYTKQIADGLRSHGVAHKVDESSGSIGRRYARTDQIGIPFAVTIDFDTLSEPNSVTLRERDSLLQVRAPVADIPNVIAGLAAGKMRWEEVMEKYPKFEQQQASK